MTPRTKADFLLVLTVAWACMIGEAIALHPERVLTRLGFAIIMLSLAFVVFAFWREK